MGATNGYFFDNSTKTNGRVIVTQSNKDITLGGIIDSTKEYFIDGIVDLGTTQVTVPTTGISLKGYSFDISGLISSENNYTMFISESPGIGSGNLLIENLYISVTGTTSKVYDLYDATGFNAIELIRINYINCTSLGDLHNYRQGLENGTGRFGGSPSLTLHGTWVGGFRITTSITRQMSDVTTEPLFKTGTAFSMLSRFLTDMNCDLGDLQPFTDFSSANFPNDSTVQFNGMIMTRGGVADSEDANITPNLLASGICCDWGNNIGLHNTYNGGIGSITAESLTAITTINTTVPLLGTWSVSDLVHFDSPSSGELRHIGGDPNDYRVAFDFSIEGGANDTIKIHLIKDDGIQTSVYTQIRVINNLQGGIRNTAYYSGLCNVTLNKNDKVFWMVENLTGTTDVTCEIDSQWVVYER
jgi:hypothetical protein